MQIAFLHLDPRPGDFSRNIDRIGRAVMLAAEAGAEWILTPELSTSGYTFAASRGVEWIGPAHDALTADLTRLTVERNVTLFLARAERDRTTGELYNSLQVFDGARGFVGSHRKVNTLKVGAEAWSSSGRIATVLPVTGVGPVGLLICADACSNGLAEEIKRRGARAIVSSANWSPGQWGPAGEWETISKRTGLPVFVCNRTGKDGDLSFSASESVVVADGLRLMSFSSPHPHLIFVDWDFASHHLIDWRSKPFE